MTDSLTGSLPGSMTAALDWKLLVLPPLIALAAALVLTPWACRLAHRLGAIDLPDGRRKFHPQATPRLGGAAVCGALALGLLVAVGLPGAGAGLQSLAWRLALSAGVVCLCGAWDDVRQLSARRKLILQLAAVAPLVLSGQMVTRVVVFGWPIELGMWGAPLTMLWLVGCINALNLLDGMDGLASIVGLSSAAMIALIGVSGDHAHVSIAALVLAGSLAGFLVYNLPPARIFLGDSGSMVIGLSVGLLGMEGALKTPTTLSLTAPAVLLSLPMWDAVLAVVRRKLLRQPIHQPDRGHIHHRLLERGLTTWQALCVIGAICLTTGGAATAATILRNDALAWIVAVSLLVLLVRTKACGHYELVLLERAWKSWRQRDVVRREAVKLAAWNAELEALGVEGLELSLLNRDGSESRCAWNAERRRPEGESWAAALRFKTALDQTLTVRVLGSVEEFSRFERQQEAVDAVERLVVERQGWLAEFTSRPWESAYEGPAAPSPASMPKRRAA